MKLVYIFMTTVVLFFSGKAVFANSDLNSQRTLSEVERALWSEGIVLKKASIKQTELSFSKSLDKPTEMPEELYRAIELESKKLYKTL